MSDAMAESDIPDFEDISPANMTPRFNLPALMKDHLWTSKAMFPQDDISQETYERFSAAMYKLCQVRSSYNFDPAFKLLNAVFYIIGQLAFRLFTYLEHPTDDKQKASIGTAAQARKNCVQVGLCGRLL
jgi:hypothetical protein